MYNEEEEPNHPVFYHHENANNSVNYNDELDDGISDDIRRKQHENKANGTAAGAAHSHASNNNVEPVLNEHNKMQLAMRTSEVLVNFPGAVHHAPGQEPVQAKPTQSSQLNLFARFRRNPKDDCRGPSRHKLDDHDSGMMIGDCTTGTSASSNTILEQEPLDDLNSRMNDYKQQYDNLEDREDERKQRRKVYLIVLLSIVCLLIIAGIVMGVVVAIKSKSNQQGSKPPSSTNDGSDEDPEEVVDFVEKIADCLAGDEAGYESSDRFMSFQDTIVTELPEMTGAIFESSSRTAARASLCWLADVDDFLLLDGNTEGGSSVVIQRFALGLIYFHFVLPKDEEEADSGDSELQASNWLQSGSECDWDYVDCHVPNNVFEVGAGDEAPPVEGEVVELHMYRVLGLRRSMPPELSLLSKLSTLELGENHLEGTIPSEIWTMKHLETLSLETNSLTGTISSDLRNLPKLRNLNLYNNNGITGTVPDLTGLSNLEHLILTGGDLGGTFPDLEGTTNLDLLHLEFVSLQGTIPSNLGSLTKLTFLKLSGLHDLDGSIPSEIGMLTELRYLSLSALPFISGSIPTELGQLTHLKGLQLTRMPGLTGTVPSEIGQLTNLASLDLKGTEGLVGSIPLEVCFLRSQKLSVLTKPCFSCETKCPV